jgi:hypothetical protein
MARKYCLDISDIMPSPKQFPKLYNMVIAELAAGTVAASAHQLKRTVAISGHGKRYIMVVYKTCALGIYITFSRK